VYISLVSLSHENEYLKGKRGIGIGKERNKKAAFKTDGRRNESKDKTVEKQHGTPPPPLLSRQYISFFHSDP